MSSFDAFARAAEQAQSEGYGVAIRRYHRRLPWWNLRRRWWIIRIWLRLGGWSCVWAGQEVDVQKWMMVPELVLGLSGSQIKIYSNENTGKAQLWLKTGGSVWTLLVMLFIMWPLVQWL